MKTISKLSSHNEQAIEWPIQGVIDVGRFNLKFSLIAVFSIFFSIKNYIGGGSDSGGCPNARGGGDMGGGMKISVTNSIDSHRTFYSFPIPDGDGSGGGRIKTGDNSGGGKKSKGVDGGGRTLAIALGPTIS